VRGALGTVDDEKRIGLPAHHCDDLTNWIHGSQRIRHVTERNDTGASVQQRLKFIEVDSAVFGELADAEIRAALDRELLPRDEVRVMLERRDDYLVSGADVVTSPCRSDED
jgi:hypothetical protein